MKETLLTAARSAGAVLMDKLGQGLKVDYKGDYDLVTEADRAAEKVIVDLVRKHFPGHDILAEEGDYGCSGADCRWIIDPLDGTTNFAHGFPWFAVSIGVEVEGRVLLGAVYNPYFDEFFYAERGGGAFLNDRPIRVSATRRLDRSLLGTGFPYDRKESTVNNYDHFVAFQQAAQACRRPGVASLDLAAVAAGRFDGYWEMKLKPWDIAAGILLVEEAGGRVSDFDGALMPLERAECLASNGLVHDEMIAILQSGRRPGACRNESD